MDRTGGEDGTFLHDSFLGLVRQCDAERQIPASAWAWAEEFVNRSNQHALLRALYRSTLKHQPAGWTACICAVLSEQQTLGPGAARSLAVALTWVAFNGRWPKNRRITKYKKSRK
jgi:hypothetical protein